MDYVSTRWLEYLCQKMAAKRRGGVVMMEDVLTVYSIVVKEYLKDGYIIQQDEDIGCRRWHDTAILLKKGEKEITVELKFDWICGLYSINTLEIKVLRRGLEPMAAITLYSLQEFWHVSEFDYKQHLPQVYSFECWDADSAARKRSDRQKAKRMEDKRIKLNRRGIEIAKKIAFRESLFRDAKSPSDLYDDRVKITRRGRFYVIWYNGYDRAFKIGKEEN